MSQVIPGEAKGVKRPARVTEPLQVIPEDEELEVKHVKTTVHVQATEHPSYATRAARKSPARTVLLLVHHPSESFNPSCAPVPLYPFPKPSRMNFIPTTFLVRNSAKGWKTDPLVQKR